MSITFNDTLQIRKVSCQRFPFGDLGSVTSGELIATDNKTGRNMLKICQQTTGRVPVSCHLSCCMMWLASWMWLIVPPGSCQQDECDSCGLALVSPASMSPVFSWLWLQSNRTYCALLLCTTTTRDQITITAITATLPVLGGGGGGCHGCGSRHCLLL